VVQGTVAKQKVMDPNFLWNLLETSTAKEARKQFCIAKENF